MPQIVFLKNQAEILRFPLSSKNLRIGRHPDNDVSLPDPEVSRFHLTIESTGTEYQVNDQSRHGTQLNGDTVTGHVLKDQDVITIGSWNIIFEQNALLREETTFRDSSSQSDTPLFCGMVAISEVMKSVCALIEKAAGVPLALMIHGETGTGKELLAQAVHQLSEKSGRFVAINCGAISPNLVESELFGHERGAFTGAVAKHQGAFEQAHEGTLFLDEIGELPLELQPKLLRVLESGRYKRVGGHEELQSDARIVAATHRHLPTLIEEGSFREDLYYRLLGLLIELPPLRERKEDIVALTQLFLEQSSPRNTEYELSSEAVEALQAYAWPGNIRELKNVLARSIVLSQKPLIGKDDLIFLGDRIKISDKSPLDRAEKDAIARALQVHGGNKTNAAQDLGIAKSTLFRKIKEYNI
jgi:two-component system, NtrC family, response regulator HydG